MGDPIKPRKREMTSKEIRLGQEAQETLAKVACDHAPLCACPVCNAWMELCPLGHPSIRPTCLEG